MPHSTPLQHAYAFAASSGLPLSTIPPRGVITVAGEPSIDRDQLPSAVAEALTVTTQGGVTELTADLQHIDMTSLLAVAAGAAARHGRPRGAMDAEAQETFAARAQTEGAEGADVWEGRILAPAPDLPVLGPPEEVTDPDIDHTVTRIDGQTWSRLASACAERGLATEAALLQACAEVVRRWSKEPGLTLTCVLSERQDANRDALGQFNLPRLVDFSAAASSTFAERVRDTMADLSEQRTAPFHDGIVVQRDLARAAGRPVSFPVVFSTALRSPGCEDLELLDVRTTTPQVWLECQVLEAGDELVVAWHHVRGLFPEGLVDTMAEAFTDLVAGLAADPGRWSRSLGIVDLPAADAREQDAANGTATDLPSVLLHRFALQGAIDHPERPAIRDDHGTVTHRELAIAALAVARDLVEAIDPRSGEPVAVMCPPGRHQVIGVLAVQLAGAAYVAIDPAMPAPRRASILDRCGARAIVTDQPAGVAGARADARRIIDVVPSRTTPADVATDLAGWHDRQEVDDLAYVIFTSGSTGTPKGVMITHANAANTVQDINRRLQIGPDDRAIAMAPAGFDLSVYDMFGLLGAGGAVVFPHSDRAGDPDHWVELVTDEEITVWNSVPAPVRLLADALDARPEGAPAACGSLRHILMSGDWIPVELPGRIRTHLPNCRIWSLGGATEGSIWSIHHRIEHVDPEWTSIPYGRALANQCMVVRDRWNEPCPRWAVGEIWIGGSGVAAGYLGDPERTADRFITDPLTGERFYRTGDLGRFLPGGDIQILGREDHQVKINGYRVELGEIESCLAQAEGVEGAVVTAPVHPGTGQRRLVAHVIGELTDDDLREICRAHLPAYMVPAVFTRIDVVPLTANGKVDRAALPEPALETASDPVDAGVSAVAADIFEIWSEHLGHCEFGHGDGFFDAGGDSLHAVGILRAVRERFGLDAGAEQELVESLFMNADVRSFSEVVERSAA